jgi:nucleotide-binding universal stress UspA family protein
MGWSKEFEEKLAIRGRNALDYAETIGRKAGVKVQPVFLRGIPAERILDYAEENGINLIVMGTQGLTGFKRFLIGSVSEKVLRYSKVPVMIIR